MKKRPNKSNSPLNKKTEFSNSQFTWILWLFIIFFVALEIYSITTHNHYKYDFIFIMILHITLYKLRNKIRLHPLHFFLFGIFLLLHNLGTFGTYKNYYFGLEYDFYTHAGFGLVAALILVRSYKLIGPYKSWFMYLVIIAVLLGFSAFHELHEYAGAILLGEGEGVLFVGAGDLDEWDTQKDMFNNMIGGISGLILYSIFKKRNTTIT
jgi:uncharacterized membrane protein YjdF